ncbi:MAG: hypothetical protein ACUVWJ_02325 [Spirochaetota bacterium]
MEPDIRIRRIPRNSLVRPTNFYPNYGEGFDRVSPIYPVRRTAFQRVLQRYRLSSTLTRDSGLGPRVETIPRPARRVIGKRKAFRF